MLGGRDSHAPPVSAVAPSGWCIRLQLRGLCVLHAERNFIEGENNDPNIQSSRDARDVLTKRLLQSEKEIGREYHIH